MNFELGDYQTVKSRKQAFYQKYPDGRIHVELLTKDTLMDHALFVAKVYKDLEEWKLGAPLAVGFAHEIRDKERPLNKYGKEYDSVNYTSWVENCEESAIGRALDNAGFATNLKCSKEEIVKAKKQAETFNKTIVHNIEPKDFVFHFGKFKGKKFEDINPKELESYYGFLEKQNPKDRTVLVLIEKYFKSLDKNE